MCGKQTEIEPEYSLLQTKLRNQKLELYTQANEINVCTEWNTDKGKNTPHLKFWDKMKILSKHFQTVLIILKLLIIKIILLGIYYERWHEKRNLEKRGKQNKKLSRQDGGKI